MARLWKFDYLKAGCIIAIILTHIPYVNSQSDNLLFAYLIYMAVPCFMIISGYLSAKSADKHNLVTIRDLLNPRKIFNKLVSIYIPFVIILALEIVVTVMFQNRQMGLKDCIYAFLTGGGGPGGYYVPILAQTVFIFPIMYWIVIKKPIRGSILIIGIQLLLEWGTQLFVMQESVYRLLLFRYFVFLWFGIILYRYADKINSKALGAMGITGASYIYLITYMGYEPNLFVYWTSTSMPTVLWAAFLVVIFVKMVKKLPKTANQIVYRIGISTYHIFLIQKLYFSSVPIYRIQSIWIMILLSIVICVVLGILFKMGEEGLQKFVGDRRWKHIRKTKL